MSSQTRTTLYESSITTHLWLRRHAKLVCLCACAGCMLCVCSYDLKANAHQLQVPAGSAASRCMYECTRHLLLVILLVVSFCISSTVDTTGCNVCYDQQACDALDLLAKVCVHSYVGQAPCLQPLRPCNSMSVSTSWGTLRGRWGLQGYFGLAAQHQGLASV